MDSVAQTVFSKKMIHKMKLVNTFRKVPNENKNNKLGFWKIN